MDSLQSLQDALQGELGTDELSPKSSSLKSPTSFKEFFPIVHTYCKNAAPQITIKNSNKFKNAVIVCLEQHYKVMYSLESISSNSVLESVQDFLIKLDMKPFMHLVEISIFPQDHVIIRLTKIWSTSSNISKFVLSKSLFCLKNWSNLSEKKIPWRIWLGDQLIFD